jgi:glucan phosphoethanolaminetransferase (alkaline phosphatase superfamily)
MKTRRRIARVILCIGASLQFLLVSALPIGQMNSGEMQSFIRLTTMFVFTFGCVIGLRRWPRASTAVLTVGSIYALYLIVSSGMAIGHVRSTVASPFSPPQAIGFVLALCALATVPIALLVAWPLRHVPTDRDLRTDITPGS